MASGFSVQICRVHTSGPNPSGIVQLETQPSFFSIALEGRRGDAEKRATKTRRWSSAVRYERQGCSHVLISRSSDRIAKKATKKRLKKAKNEWKNKYRTKPDKLW